MFDVEYGKLSPLTEGLQMDTIIPASSTATWAQSRKLHIMNFRREKDDDLQVKIWNKLCWITQSKRYSLDDSSVGASQLQESGEKEAVLYKAGV